MVVVALVVVGIATAVVVTVAMGTSDDSSTAGPTTTRPPLSGPGAELVDLVSKSGGNFDVAYTVSGQAGQSSAHLWRRPPLGRLDAESGSGDGARRNTVLMGASGPASCTAQGSGPWTCVAKPGLNLNDVGVVPPALLARLSGLEVSVADDEILGQAVRCFTLSPAQGAPEPPAELCLTPDGIAARVVTGSGRLDAVSLQRGRLPDSAFEPPAPVG